MTAHLEHFLRQPLRQGSGKDDGGGSFTGPVFDAEYYGRDQAGGRARTIGLVVGVVAGAVIAGFAAWTVFGPGSEIEGGRTPLIVAEPEPYKVRPKDPGGMQVENQDKLVYGRIGGAFIAPEAENILPPPETPKIPEPVIAIAPTSEPALAVAVEPPPASLAAARLGSPAPVLTTEPASNAPEPAPAQSAIAAAPKKPPGQTLESIVAALSGDYLIQIAALRSEEAAEGEWKRVRSRHANLLGSYSQEIVRVDLGVRGIFYRLRAGPLKDRGSAEKLCESLAAENVGCLVVRNE
ncbi:MAG: SPOR domain-containing protein [Rhodospirillaceae bacterium]|nr:SPOR domain-containing protein [Rhodospirillaceae bacterium]